MKQFFKTYSNELIIGAVVLVIIIASYFAIKSKSKGIETSDNKPNPSPTPGSGSAGSGTFGTKPHDDNFPLKQGSYGDNVKYLQNALNRIRPASKLTPDGDFGQQTYNALLLAIGTRVNSNGLLISAYPVTQQAFNAILHQANSI